MITDEQFKNLKPGDTLVLEITVAEIALGRIYYNGTNCMDCCYPDEVSLPPKHDPCRKFKEGDIVDYRRRYGRDYETVPDPGDYKLARVISSEDEESGMVGVEFVEAYGGDDACFAVPWFHLELVTPVEEMEPYEVTESSDYYGVDKDDLEVEAAIFWKKSHPHAKAAAEDECARLNAEYRKEQK